LVVSIGTGHLKGREGAQMTGREFLNSLSNSQTDISNQTEEQTSKGFR
jgi:hypothetical protein